MCTTTTYLLLLLPLRPSREMSLDSEVMMDAARLTEPQAEHMVRVVGTFLMDKRTALKGRCVVSVSVCASEASYQVPWWRLQPCVEEAATVRGGGCNRAWWRLQPCVSALGMCTPYALARYQRHLGSLPRPVLGAPNALVKWDGAGCRSGL